MKQGVLPLIPSGVTEIDSMYSVSDNDSVTTWFQGCCPIRVHPSSDHAGRRAMTAFLHVHGGVPQISIANALGLHENTLKATVKLYREKGDAAFYARTPPRGPAVLTKDVMERCRGLLLAGKSRSEVAAEVGVRKCNIDKAIQKKLLPESTRSAAHGGSTRSARVKADADAATAMGTACVRVEERTMAACGLLKGAASVFEECVDVEHGGVLCALPALLANGLLEHLSHIEPPRQGGFYYSLTHVLILLSLMALLRVKTVESLRDISPGEFGRLLGLDRIPEVRCLRDRLASLSAVPDAVSGWADALSRSWMAADPDVAGTLYVDGHVSVYHGGLTELPRRYVAGRRLCMRGVTDYWVNDRHGRPFFYVDRPVDDGLLGVLRSVIVPKLLDDVPGQPSDKMLEVDKLAHRFRIIFDRAGYSPRFMAEMWREHRVACMTYRKTPGEDWPESEFRKVDVTLANGESIQMELAEREVWLGGDKDGVMCREFRRLKRGRGGDRQVSIVGTDHKCSIEEGVPAMFARWGQENFFKYMLSEFGLDLRPDHSTELFPCTVQVVNPAWRALDSECRSIHGKKLAAKLRMADLSLELHDMEPGKADKWLEEKSRLHEEIKDIDGRLKTAQARRRDVPKHIPFDKLPDDQKFERLEPTRKLLLDTIRMIAYRAETAMASLLREAIPNPDEARSVLKAMFNTSVDLRPDEGRGELRVILHPLAEPRLNRAVAGLLADINDAEVVYPGTRLKMVYQIMGMDPGT